MEDATKAPRNVPPLHPAGDPAAGTRGYAALHGSAALVDRPLGVLRLSGRDPAGMLDAVLTSDVPKGPNAGVYALLLDPKGRIQTDLRVLKSGEHLLILTEPGGLEAAETILGRYAPFSRVKVEGVTDRAVLGLYGPEASGVLGARGLAEHETAELSVAGVRLVAAGVQSPVGGYDLILPSGALDAVRDHLTRRGAVPAEPADYETVRVEAGVPRFGGELTPNNFPGESSVLQRAVDFKKGCYPGQETVARMHYRGSPNKVLYRFELADVPAEPTGAGAEILQDEKQASGPVPTVDVTSYVTSVSPLAVNGRRFALGYLPRKVDPKAPMRVEDAPVIALRPA
jgi:tRNA-modifying protein YgfZ